MVLDNKQLTDILVMVIIGAFLGFIAPFGVDYLPLIERICYWVLVCVIGYLIYKPVIHFFDIKWSVYFPNFIPHFWIRIVLGTGLASIPATIVLWFINSLFFSFNMSHSEGSLRLFPSVLIIGAAISAISIMKNLIEDQRQALQISAQDNEFLQEKLNVDPYEEINKHLPMSKRGKLLCIETADHYVNLTTDEGSELVLMRFKDALQLLQHAPGMQVHRSWWVALDAIVNVRKSNRKVQLTLVNGNTVPVSKSHIEALKEAGIK